VAEKDRAHGEIALSRELAKRGRNVPGSAGRRAIAPAQQLQLAELTPEPVSQAGCGLTRVARGTRKDVRWEVHHESEESRHRTADKLPSQAESFHSESNGANQSTAAVAVRTSNDNRFDGAVDSARRSCRFRARSWLNSRIWYAISSDAALGDPRYNLLTRTGIYRLLL
jgi:hypothetical protein